MSKHPILFWTLLSVAAIAFPYFVEWYYGPPPVMAPAPLPLPPLAVQNPPGSGNIVYYENLMFECRKGVWYDAMTGKACKPVKVGSKWTVGPVTVDGELYPQIQVKRAFTCTAF